MSSFRSLVAGIVVAGLAAIQLVTASASSAATPVPYVDPGAIGQITLCNSAGQPLTSGRLDTKPFVASAVGSTAAPTAYQAAGRTATLFGYQPIKGVDPSLWSGQQMTAAGKYSNSEFPMAASTWLDQPLSTLVTDYPPRWDGLLELRLFLGAPYQPTYTTAYNAATIQIHGKTWSLVQGGKAPCNAGTSVSDEEILPAFHQSPRPTAATGTGHSTSGSTAASAAPAGAAASAQAQDTTAGGTSAVDEASASTKSGGSSAVLIAAVVVVALVCGAVGTLIWRRRVARIHL